MGFIVNMMRILLLMLPLAPLSIAQLTKDSEGALRAALLNLKLEKVDPDPDVISVRLVFDLDLRNGRGEPIEVGVSPYFTVGVQFRRAGQGTWKQLTTSSWYDDGSIKYSACSLVKAGGQIIVDKLDTAITTFKRTFPAESSVNFRLQLETACRSRINGKLKVESIQTEPFTLKLVDP